MPGKAPDVTAERDPEQPPLSYPSFPCARCPHYLPFPRWVPDKGEVNSGRSEALGARPGGSLHSPGDLRGSGFFPAKP